MPLRPTEHLSINDPNLPSVLGFMDYEVYAADTLAEAHSFLEKVAVHEPRSYVVVETPEGVLGKDCGGVYRPSASWRGADLDEPGRSATIALDDVIATRDPKGQIMHWWPHCPPAVLAAALNRGSAPAQAPVPPTAASLPIPVLSPAELKFRRIVWFMAVALWAAVSLFAWSSSAAPDPSQDASIKWLLAIAAALMLASFPLRNKLRALAVARHDATLRQLAFVLPLALCGAAFLLCTASWPGSSPLLCYCFLPIGSLGCLLHFPNRS
jgi:hypothetical protein